MVAGKGYGWDCGIRCSYGEGYGCTVVVSGGCVWLVLPASVVGIGIVDVVVDVYFGYRIRSSQSWYSISSQTAHQDLCINSLSIYCVLRKKLLRQIHPNKRQLQMWDPDVIAAKQRALVNQIYSKCITLLSAVSSSSRVQGRPICLSAVCSAQLHPLGRPESYDLYF